MKHTIKLLTLAFMLATILALTGCPGPVNNYIEPPVWDDGVVTTEPTCTEDGVKTYTCSNGETRTETIPALGHDFGEWEITKNPTCTEKGSKTRKCSRCGETETVEIDALGHDWELESDTATCTEDGVKTYKCSRCNETRTEDSPAHHTFIAGGCDKCGAYEYSGTQVKVYVYTFTEDKELNDLGILYYSFEETDKTMELNNLLHLKPTYKDYTVAYCEYYFNPNKKDNLKNVNPYIPWEDKLNSPIGIIIEPTN